MNALLKGYPSIVPRTLTRPRVSGACFAMGEAAGTAAALTLGGNMGPREIDVGKLQLQLRQQGAFIGQDQAVPAGL